MNIIDFTNTCSNCRFNDGLVYASNPVKYKCTFDNNYYEGYHSCHLDLVPVTRCKNCDLFLTIKDGKEDEFYKDYPWDWCIGLGYDGLCKSTDKWTANDDYCNYGEIKK